MRQCSLDVIAEELIAKADVPIRLAALRANRLHETAVTTLLDQAIGIALKHDISVYDATYVAASEIGQAPLVTADMKLVRKMIGTPYTVLFLGSLTLPGPPAAPGATGSP